MNANLLEKLLLPMMASAMSGSAISMEPDIDTMSGEARSSLQFRGEQSAAINHDP